MSEMILRKEALEMGFPRGRLDYFVAQGYIKSEKRIVCKRVRVWLDKAQVEHFMSMPIGTVVSEKPRKAVTPKVYLTKKNYKLALTALGICAQLMKNESIKARFDGFTVEDLISAATAFEARINK